MKLLLLCLLFGVAVARITYEPIGDEQSNGCNSDETDIAVTACPPGHWCPCGSLKYIYFSTCKTWANAQAHCVALGGSLAAVHDSVTAEFLKSLAQEKPAWIGLSDAQCNNVWLWSNSDPVDYTKWCRGEPNNHGGDEACVEMNFTYAKCWNDQTCKSNRPYICQKK